MLRLIESIVVSMSKEYQTLSAGVKNLLHKKELLPCTLNWYKKKGKKDDFVGNNS